MVAALPRSSSAPGEVLLMPRRPLVISQNKSGDALKAPPELNCTWPVEPDAPLTTPPHASVPAPLVFRAWPFAPSDEGRVLVVAPAAAAGAKPTNPDVD